MTWAVMMRWAFHRGIAPAAFWRLSLTEWRMLTQEAAVPSMSRNELALLADTWPDEVKHD